MNRRQIGLAILRGALGQVPLAGPIGAELIRSWELSELIGERIDHAIEARFASTLLPLIEALASHVNGPPSVTTGMIEALSEQAVARLEPSAREALADQARRLSTAPDNGRAAEYAATLVGQVLDQPEVRSALATPLLAGPGAVRLQEGALLAGRYRVVGVLGLGAHATVYHARDDDDGRDVAIKIGAETGPGWQRQLHREGLRLARLDHPGIVRVHETITVAVGPESKPRAAIVMDLIDGSTLRAHVAERGGRLPWSKARPLIEGLLGALEHAHSQGVLHLDVKPENIMVLDGGRAAKVLDFGLARLHAPHADRGRGLREVLELVRLARSGGAEAAVRGEDQALDLRRRNRRARGGPVGAHEVDRPGAAHGDHAAVAGDGDMRRVRAGEGSAQSQQPALLHGAQLGEPRGKLDLGHGALRRLRCHRSGRAQGGAEGRGRRVSMRGHGHDAGPSRPPRWSRRGGRTGRSSPSSFRAGDVVYWLDAGPNTSPMLKALDLRSGLEIESLDLGPSKTTVRSTIGNVRLAACATRVVLLAKRGPVYGPSTGLVLAYEPI